LDLMVGNLGLNSPFRPTATEPVCIYAKDYDKNGRIDPIMCKYENGKEYMVHSRDDINKQITPMRARFRDYTAYASATLEKAFRADEIEDAYVVRLQKTESVYLTNTGNLRFDLQNLPIEAQFAPINAMVIQDFNQDGHLDVLAAGNSYATEVQTGRYDAMGTVLLFGNGKGGFVPDRKALNCIGDNRALVAITNARGQKLIFIAANDAPLKAYKPVKS
jgi:enediyne biosynthesis protein E4